MLIYRRRCQLFCVKNKKEGERSMLTSLSFIFLVGLAMGAICQKLKLPRIIGMLATGIVLGQYVLDLLDPSILSISADLRKKALIVILLKAGLSLNLDDLKKVGRPAIMMSFVPASFEIIGYLLFAPAILGITRVEAAVMGSVLATVSPGSRCTENGSADGDEIRNRESDSTDDHGRSIL